MRTHRTFFAQHKELKQSPLDPRDGFFGERTNARMVCDNNKPVYINNERKIARTAGFDIVSKPERKVYGVNYTKRRRLNDSFDTLSYGH